MAESTSLEKGREVLRQLRGGEKPGAMGNIAEEVFPDFWRMTQEHVLGEVWSRPGLALRDRSMITVATLTALARSEELKGHMTYALNIGITREEILEMIMHIAHYAGWPVAMNALRVAKEVFASRK